MSGNVIIRFDEVSFGYNQEKKILDKASFSVREDAKITIMGQNGAGKSTIFKMILGAGSKVDETLKDLALKPTSGKIHITNNATIGIGLQVMPKKFMDYTVLEYFATAFGEKKHDLERLVNNVLEIVEFSTPMDKKINAFSGGQLARLLLAHALIQEPDILLLDEPTNNLDQEGIDHLTGFLMVYPKTVLVISHDAEFLNSFTEGVLNLDIYTQKVDQYVGDYFDVVDQLSSQVEKEQRKNAQLKKNIQDRKDKVNFFSNKGGKMRRLAAKMKEEIEEDVENMVDVKKEDRTIRPFKIEAETWPTVIAEINTVDIFIGQKKQTKKTNLKLFRRSRLLVKGPNGMGKSTLLRELALGKSKGAVIPEGVKIGYYQQDFSGLNFEHTVHESLEEVTDAVKPQEIYDAAGHFMLSTVLKNKVSSLSEGQKGLLCYARFVLQKPSLLILDEPTNHINFRHIPVIAEAIEDYDGALILVSHMPEFVEQIEMNEELDLQQLADSK